MRRNKKKRPGDISSAGARKRQLIRMYEKYQGICQLCFKFCPQEEASRDHVIELAAGGSSDDSNMVLAHKKCNEAKSVPLSRKKNREAAELHKIKCAEAIKTFGSRAEAMSEQWWSDRIRQRIKSTLIKQRIGVGLDHQVFRSFVGDQSYYSNLADRPILAV